MKGKFEFTVECGEKTCASIPGEFCRFFIPDFKCGKCFFFGSLNDKNGWVQRHEDCLKNMIKISD